MTKFPFASLILLLAAYGSFSWFLYQATTPWSVWLGMAIFALTQALLLTALSQGLRAYIQAWLNSDIGYFSMVLVSAFSIALVLVWFNVFEYILMVLATEILARFDLQTAGLNRWQSLIVLTIVSLLGLSIGWVADRSPLPPIKVPIVL